jgi:WhiB family redox-sensing transcriptional regulator
MHELAEMGGEGINNMMSLPSLKFIGSIDWREQASCSDLPKAVFFEYNSVSIPFSKRKHFKGIAVRTCAKCPVRSDCYEFAVKNDEQFGIWAGLTPDERKPIAKAFKKTGILETLS